MIEINRKKWTSAARKDLQCLFTVMSQFVIQKRKILECNYLQNNPYFL